MTVSERLLPDLWHCGYSIAELWGFTPPVTRPTSDISEPHGLQWGILRLAEDQIDKGAGHAYLRQRIAAGDWIGIGSSESSAGTREFVIVPKLKDAKFGRKKSAVGDGTTNFVNVRFVHQKLFEELTRDDGPPD
jgi:hypothetical protein